MNHVIITGMKALLGLPSQTLNNEETEDKAVKALSMHVMMIIGRHGLSLQPLAS